MVSIIITLLTENSSHCASIRNSKQTYRKVEGGPLSTERRKDFFHDRMMSKHMWTFNRKAGDSLDPDKNCDELLHRVELEVVVHQAHPAAVVPTACLG